MKNQFLLFTLCLGLLSLFSCKSDSSSSSTNNSTDSNNVSEKMMIAKEDSLLNEITIELDKKESELDAALEELEAEFPEN